MPPRRRAYSFLAQTIHGTTVLLVLALVVLALLMTQDDLFASMTRLRLFGWHKSLGLLVLLLSLTRVLWRWIGDDPVIPLKMNPKADIVMPRFLYGTLYGLLLIVPLTGWIMSSTSFFNEMLFGFFMMPRFPFVAGDPDIGKFFQELHGPLALALLVAAGLHIATVLRHHFIARDEILLRMVPAALRPFLVSLRPPRAALSPQPRQSDSSSNKTDK